MSEKQQPQLGVHRIVMPFHVIDYKKMMRQKSNSYTIADGWTIAWASNGWKVYHKAIDATYRLHVGSRTAGKPRDITFASFQGAWTWVEELTPWQIEIITVNSFEA